MADDLQAVLTADAAGLLGSILLRGSLIGSPWSSQSVAEPPRGKAAGGNEKPRGTQKLDRVPQALGVDHDVKSAQRRARVPQRSLRRRRSQPFIFVVMAMFAGPSRYHEPSAQDARRRIIAFFDIHLRT